MNRRMFLAGAAAAAGAAGNAAKLAVEGGKQVAVLAPTTILAQQHLQTFRHRFRNHPVRIEMVSRFLTNKEIAEILQDTATGKVDIVIGGPYSSGILAGGTHFEYPNRHLQFGCAALRIADRTLALPFSQSDAA